jgi:hypothetical protein
VTAPSATSHRLAHWAAQPESKRVDWWIQRIAVCALAAAAAGSRARSLTASPSKRRSAAPPAGCFVLHVGYRHLHVLSQVCDEPGSGFRLYQIAHLVALLTAQSDNPATGPACPTAGKDHLVASAGETQRRIRQIIICTASSASTSSSRTSRFQVWKSSATRRARSPRHAGRFPASVGVFLSHAPSPNAISSTNRRAPRCARPSGRQTRLASRAHRSLEIHLN